jgi:hypothetical protein
MNIVIPNERSASRELHLQFLTVSTESTEQSSVASVLSVRKTRPDGDLEVIA